ncbi:hypothetical protein N9Z27_00500 [Alphaproteobacteria bacterium]|nr:hypothetical protein [Alphaproteobacteria bacterium]
MTATSAQHTYNFPGKKHFDKALPLYMAAIFCYIQLSPMYIFPRGIPQPADILIALTIFPALIIIFLSSKKSIPDYYLAGAIFVALTMVINWVNYLFYSDLRLLLSSTYYLYNFLIFTFAVYIFKHYAPQMRKLAYVAIIIAIIVQFIWLTLFPDIGVKRMTGSFINPNQLGYWAMITFMTLTVLKHNQKFKWYDGILILILTYFEALALSKGGMIAFGLALAVIVCMPQVPKIGKALVVFGLLVMMIFGLFNVEKFGKVQNSIGQVDLVVQRLQSIGQSEDDSAAGRNYDRLIQFPEFMIFGAGEGGFARFDHHPNEIHSGIATLIFSYGIPGTLSYLAFLGLILIKRPWYYSALVFCILLYGLTHQYMRFSDYWFFLGILYASQYFPKQIPKQIRA